jgi:hypothetical protein
VAALSLPSPLPVFALSLPSPLPFRLPQTTHKIFCKDIVNPRYPAPRIEGGHKIPVARSAIMEAMDSLFAWSMATILENNNTSNELENVNEALGPKKIRLLAINVEDEDSLSVAGVLVAKPVDDGGLEVEVVGTVSEKFLFLQEMLIEQVLRLPTLASRRSHVWAE